MNQPSPGARAFFEARDLLLRYRDDYAAAKTQFRWPQLDQFNWATDVFDTLGSNPSATALRLVDDAGVDSSLSFAEVAARRLAVRAYCDVLRAVLGSGFDPTQTSQPCIWRVRTGITWRDRCLPRYGLCGHRPEQEVRCCDGDVQSGGTRDLALDRP